MVDHLNAIKTGVLLRKAADPDEKKTEEILKKEEEEKAKKLPKFNLAMLATVPKKVDTKEDEESDWGDDDDSIGKVPDTSKLEIRDEEKREAKEPLDFSEEEAERESRIQAALFAQKLQAEKKKQEEAAAKNLSEAEKERLRTEKAERAERENALVGTITQKRGVMHSGLLDQEDDWED